MPDTFPTALRLARTGGVLVEAGAFVDLGPVGVNPDGGHLHAERDGDRHRRASCSRTTRRRSSCSRATTTRLPVDRIVTHRLPLARAQDAIELAQRDGAMKVVLDPTLAL